MFRTDKEWLLKKIKEKAEKDKDITAVLVFGSYLSKKGYRDIDVCLVLNKKLSNLKVSKKKLSYQKVSSKIDVQILQQLPLYIKMEVIRKNKPILIKNHGQLFDIARDIIRDFDSFEKHYNDYLEYVKNGYKEKAVV